MKIEHIALYVNDLNAARDFFMHGRTLTPDGLRIICASFDYGG